ncbi:MAG: GNAT family protein [Anaerolineales bacterium]
MSVIYGERVRLRAAERDDVKKFTEWVNDPEVTRGITLFIPMSSIDEEKWFENAMQRPQEEKPLVIDMKDGDGWHAIGNSGFFGFDWIARSAEVGIMIGEKSVWNQGYGTETMRLLLRHAFRTLNLHRVFLRVHADNVYAIRAYEKVGFVHEGRLRKAVYQHGAYLDLLMMSVLRAEWDALQKEK